MSNNRQRSDHNSIAIEIANNPALLNQAERRFAVPRPPKNREWPEPLDVEALYGLAGEVVEAIGPQSEADPAGLLVQFLASFGSCVGPSAHFDVERTPHHTNLFALLVGDTARGRKGTSWGQIRRLFQDVDEGWHHHRVVSGLSSGEGLIWQVRDAIERTPEHSDKSGNLILDAGVPDKRLLVLEEEFSSPLKVMERHGNTLSPVLRDAWGTGSLSSLTKNSPARATGAHISIIGHITRAELLRHLDGTECANGFANRFLFVAVRRSKMLPNGGSLPPDAVLRLHRRISAALAFAREVREMRRDRDAQGIWERVYPELTADRPGLLAAVTARSDPQVLRLSMLYALLDQSPTIRTEHLRAALAVWDYCYASAKFVFGDALGIPEADEIRHALRETPEGLSRTEIRDLFGRHKSSKQIADALDTLQGQGIAESILLPGEGRSVEVWRLIESATKAT
jgi:hypothetical protein